MWSWQHSLLCKTRVTGSTKTYGIFGIRDFPLFETGDSGFYSTSRVSFGIESMSWGGEMQNSHRDYVIERNFGSGLRVWRTLLGTLEIRIQNPKIFVFEIQNMGNFSCGVQNPGLWNLEYGSRNLDPTNNCNPDSKFHWQRIQNPVPGIQNTRRKIRNQGMSWIPICGMKFCFPNFKSRETSGLDGKQN